MPSLKLQRRRAAEQNRAKPSFWGGPSEKVNRNYFRMLCSAWWNIDFWSLPNEEKWFQTWKWDCFQEMMISKKSWIFTNLLFIFSSMHIVWHQVTTILETVFLFWNEKNQSKKCWTPEMSKVVDVFSYVRKTRPLFRRICARNTWISQMQMAMPAMLS